MVSKTKINDMMRRKTNSYLAETIFHAKKAGLLKIAQILAGPTKQQASVNLGRLNEAKSDSVIIPGKILSVGELNKKLKVYAMSISETVKEKLKKSGSEFYTILAALKKGEKIKGDIIK